MGSSGPRLSSVPLETSVFRMDLLATDGAAVAHTHGVTGAGAKAGVLGYRRSLCFLFINQMDDRKILQ